MIDGHDNNDGAAASKNSESINGNKMPKPLDTNLGSTMPSNS